MDAIRSSGAAQIGGTQWLQRPGGRLGYEVAGSGPLVVCLPGMGELRNSFRYMAPALVEAGFRVAALDLRGHGDSDATFESYDDIAAGQDTLALIDELGGPAVIVGNSMGAAAAVLAAAERPEAVAGLILVGPFVRNAPMNPLMVLLFRLAMSGPWAPKMWTSYLPNLYPGRRPDDFDAHVNEIRESMRREGHRAAFTATTRTSHAPAEARLDQVRAPVLVIMGERDPDFGNPKQEAEWIAAKLRAETVIVPNSGHYPQVEYPEQVNPAVLRFLQKVAPRA